MSLYNTAKQAIVNVSSAGTRVALAASETPFKLALIQAKPGNGGVIYVGSNAVSSAAYGASLSPTSIYSIGMGSSDNDARFDLSQIYIDTSNSTDGVSILYF